MGLLIKTDVQALPPQNRGVNMQKGLQKPLWFCCVQMPYFAGMIPLSRAS